MLLRACFNGLSIRVGTYISHLLLHNKLPQTGQPFISLQLYRSEVQGELRGCSAESIIRLKIASQIRGSGEKLLPSSRS